MPLLENKKICLTGKFSGRCHTDLEQQIIKNGGCIVKSPLKSSRRCTNVIASPRAIQKCYGPVQQGWKFNIPVVKPQWLLDSISLGALQPVDLYIIPPPPQYHQGYTGPDNGGLGPSEPGCIDCTLVPAADAYPGLRDNISQKPSSAQYRPVDATFTVPPDPEFRQPAHMHVYIEPVSGLIWDATLSLSQASSNINKFVRLQILTDGYQNFGIWLRRGRVGSRGNCKILAQSYNTNAGLISAINQFRGEFRTLAGLEWDNRLSEPVLKKYVFVEKRYDTNDNVENDGLAHTSGIINLSESFDGAWLPKSSLDPGVETLIRLIFKDEYVKSRQIPFFNLNKLPLGPLSEFTIARGLDILRLVHEAINYGDHAQISHLSDRYYCLIPHVFNKQNKARPMTIFDVIAEVQFLDSQSSLKNGFLMLQELFVKPGLHPLECKLKNLWLNEIEQLDARTQEYIELRSYLLRSQASTHRIRYQFEDIFRIRRQGEWERFEESRQNIPSRRRLLWHGSQTLNFSGILSQGLRIAPPHTLSHGRMFGRGLYLADVSSKSAQYCHVRAPDYTGLLLLCEAELSMPVLNLYQASSTAAQQAQEVNAISVCGVGRYQHSRWKDAACVHPSLAGVEMPDVTHEMCRDLNPGLGSSLMYNEYVVYNEAHVRLRYILRVQMHPV